MRGLCIQAELHSMKTIMQLKMKVHFCFSRDTGLTSRAISHMLPPLDVLVNQYKKSIASRNSESEQDLLQRGLFINQEPRSLNRLTRKTISDSYSTLTTRIIQFKKSMEFEEGGQS